METITSKYKGYKKLCNDGYTYVLVLYDKAY
jgi:hypothetical protein